MRRDFLTILLSIATAALVGLRCSLPLAGGTPADDFPNAIHVTAKTVSGKPVAGAAVYIRSVNYLSDTSALHEQLPRPDARTDAFGAAKLDSLANGNYIIEVSNDSIGIGIACTLSAQKRTIVTLPDAILESFGTVVGHVNFDGAKTPYARTYGIQRVSRVDTLTGEYRIPRVPKGRNYTLEIQVFSPTPAVPPVDISIPTIAPGFPTNAPPVTLLTFDRENYTQWPYSHAITLNTTASGANVADPVVNFPVLLRFNQSAIAFSQAESDGHDIRFAKADGTHLRYEIESWDAANHTAAVWVLLDTLRGDNITPITLYWGKSNSADFSDGSKVFSLTNNNMGVWHLGGPMDACGTVHSLITSSAPTAAPGLIGNAMRFDGIGNFWAVPHWPDLDGNDNFSISVWAQWLGAAAPAYNRIISNKQAWNDPAGFELLTISGNDSAIDIRAQDSIGNGPLGVIPSWKAHGWNNITLVWNNDTCSIYVNGALVNKPLISALNTANNLVFGSNVGNTEQTWNGCLDEIRLTRGQLSAAWIKLCYMNQKTDDALCNY
jgi:hypothetical protein